jgi:mRNA interferase RelE/StbE
MAGEENVYRIRVGDWRIVYEIRTAVTFVLVIRIGHRREVYK